MIVLKAIPTAPATHTNPIAAHVHITHRKSPGRRHTVGEEQEGNHEQDDKSRQRGWLEQDGHRAQRQTSAPNTGLAKRDHEPHNERHANKTRGHNGDGGVQLMRASRN